MGDLSTLNSLVERLSQAGKYAEAIPVAQRALALTERLYGPDTSTVATSLDTLAALYRTQRRYTDAEPLLQRALAHFEKALGPDHPQVATTLQHLAALYNDQRRYTDAEPLLQRALASREKALGPDHPQVATTLYDLAALYRDEHRYTEAEPLYQRALASREKALGPDHPQVATTLHDLAGLYRDEGRYTEAEPLLQRVLASREKALGPDHPDVATSLNSLAVLYMHQDRYTDAEPLLQRALALVDKAPDHPDVATTLGNLAALYQFQRRYTDAEPLLQRALALAERLYGSDAPVVARGLNNLALLYQNQGRYTDAEPLYRRTLALIEKVLGPDYPEMAGNLNNFGSLYFRQGDWVQAAHYFQQSCDSSMRRSRRGVQTIGSPLTSRGERVTRQLISFCLALVKTSYRLAEADPARAPQIAVRMFETAQWAHLSKAAQALAQMATRHAKGDGVLAHLIRERQDLGGEWQAKDQRLMAAWSQTFDKRNATAESELRDRLSAIDVRIADIDRTLKQEFPDYAALANPEPLTVAEVQALLAKDEAVVLFLDTPAWDPTPEETFIWVVTKTDSPKWLRIDRGTPALQREVQALRCGLDEQEWVYPSDARRCADLLGLTAQPAPSQPLPFHLDRAYELYKALFGPIEDRIRGKHLILVPAGPLTSLPFQVLVTQKPETPLPATFEGYRNVVWLGRTTALTVLPSMASLKALRVYTAQGEKAVHDYIGYGNPVLKGDGRACRLAQVPATCPTVDVAGHQHAAAAEHIGRATIRGRVGRRSPSLDEVFAKGAASVAVLEQVRALCPLPETAYEITCIAEHFQESARLIRLAANATKADIQALSAQGTLARYRIVHFATHGLLSGDVEDMTKRQGEPALVLTPPEKPQDMHDDGLLLASDVAQLQLNADWVVLSACNTAAGDRLGAEALSGLARAFFYAQARALLVSHWPVYSDAAVRLTTRVFTELDRDRQAGRAEALQHAMTEFMDDPSQPDNAHPAVWAPFMVVGEGRR
jgi:CHAT domain-containing protein/tetratricopeptide (TPR) repeat protein